MLVGLGQAGTSAIRLPNDVIENGRPRFGRCLNENDPDLLFPAPNHAAEALAFAHPDNQGESIRNPEMRPDFEGCPRQRQVGNSARYRGDTKADRPYP